ncbi:hypothetical protein [Aureispira sp. CCB-E]|uniref:hypothetical protein n=1 Tax=Aureispira sp. CCB-E TaxID=3051121 RepID=UPI002868E724|nr:hypothetical protein [Aureispira sp. CCB-E]WMX13150.1 hypothetical protein QP953_20110 [Aureispira sp. CCB-E]
MKSISSILLICSLFFPQENSLHKAPKIFEGIITYEIITKSNIEGVSDERLSEITGTKLIKYVKGNKVLSKYYSSQNTLIEERLLLKDEGKNFSYSPKRDSIFWYYCSEDKNQTKIIDVKSEGHKKFLGFKCNITIFEIKFLSEPIDYTVEYVYYCSKKFPKNNEKNACTDVIDSTLNSMVIAWDVNGFPTCDRKFVPQKIERKKLDDSIFKLSKDLPLKKV